MKQCLCGINTRAGTKNISRRSRHKSNKRNGFPVLAAVCGFTVEKFGLPQHFFHQINVTGVILPQYLLRAGYVLAG